MPHVLGLDHCVVHQPSDQLLGSFVDFVDKSFSACIDSVQSRVHQRMTLVAPDEPLVWRALHDVVELALVLQCKEPEGRSLLLLAQQLPQGCRVLDIAVLCELEHRV